MKATATGDTKNLADWTPAEERQPQPESTGQPTEAEGAGDEQRPSKLGRLWRWLDSRPEALKSSRLVDLVICSLTTYVCILAACSYADFATTGELLERWEAQIVIAAAIVLLVLGWRENKSLAPFARFLVITIGLIGGIVHFTLSTPNPEQSFLGVLNGSTNRAIARADELLFDIGQFVNVDKLPPPERDYTRAQAKKVISSMKDVEEMPRTERKAAAIEILAARKTLLSWKGRGRQRLASAHRLSAQSTYRVYGPGTYSFSLRKEEITDHWIMFPAGRNNTYDVSSSDNMFKLMYDDGDEVSACEVEYFPDKIRAKFRIIALEDQNIKMIVR